MKIPCILNIQCTMYIVYRHLFVILYLYNYIIVYAKIFLRMLRKICSIFYLQGPSIPQDLWAYNPIWA